jgi:hypothetical protein
MAKLTKSNLLHQAMYSNDVPALRKLVKGGAKIDGTTKSSRTTLLATACGTKMVTDETIFAIIDLGADVNGRGPDELGALEQAARYGRIAVMERLLAKGADVNAADSKGTTAIMSAVRFGRADATKFLIDKGARADVTNATAESLYDLADRALRGEMPAPDSVKEKLRKIIAQALGGKKPKAAAAETPVDLPAEYGAFLAGDPTKRDSYMSPLLPGGLPMYRIYFLADGKVKGKGAAGVIKGLEADVVEQLGKKAAGQLLLLAAFYNDGVMRPRELLVIDRRKTGKNGECPVFVFERYPELIPVAGSIADFVASLS